MIREGKVRSILYMLFGVIIILYSGSILYMHNNLQLQLGIVPITLFLLVMYNKRCGLKKLMKFRRCNFCQIGFIWILLFSVVANMIMESSVSQFVLLFGYELAIILDSYIISELVGYDTFCYYYKRIITAFALLSLVLFNVPDFVKSIAPLKFGVNWKFASLYFYNLNTSVSARNCGPFWEPGMYQAYLIFALYLIVTGKKEKRDYFRIIVLIATLITTYSTTGYFCAVLIVALAIIGDDQNGARKRFIASFALVLLACVLACNLDTVMSLVDQRVSFSVFSKLQSENLSASTRINAGIIDLYLAKSRPFGIDRAQLNSLISQTMSQLSVITTASTNTFTSYILYFGWIAGTWYIFLWVRGCMSQGVSLLKKIIVLVMMAVILMTELHIDLWFFNIIMFYWNKNIASEESEDDFYESVMAD